MAGCWEFGIKSRMALHVILFKQGHIVLKALQVPVARKQTRSRYDGGPCLGEHCGHFGFAAASFERLGGTTCSSPSVVFEMLASICF